MKRIAVGLVLAWLVARVYEELRREGERKSGPRYRIGP